MLSRTTMLRRLSAVHPTAPGCRILPRTIHKGRITQRQPDPRNPVSHDAENYFVDGDDTPPSNASVYKVDATSDAVESAYEPPSGPWSRAGAGTEEYRTVNADEPYDVPNSLDAKTKREGRKRYMGDGGLETSKTDEGPQGTGRWGRKPEGRA